MARYEQLAGYAIAGGFELPAELRTKAAEASRYSVVDTSFSGVNGATGVDGERLLDYAIKAAAKTLTVDHMRPAFEAVLAEARQLPRDTATTVSQAFTTNPKGQSDYRKLCELVDRYQAIIAAARLIYNCPTICDVDRNEVFIDCRNVAPGNFYSPDFYRSAGPAEPFSRLLFLAHHSGAWLPTPGERLERYEEFRRNLGTGGNMLHDMSVSNREYF